jgi:hypothetical protein
MGARCGHVQTSARQKHWYGGGFVRGQCPDRGTAETPFVPRSVPRIIEIEVSPFSRLRQKIFIEPFELNRAVNPHTNVVLDHKVSELLPVDENDALGKMTHELDCLITEGRC